MISPELLAGAPLVALFVGAIATRRRRRRPEGGGYQEWLEQNRGGMNLECDECGRDDGTHGPDCGWRLIG